MMMNSSFPRKKKRTKQSLSAPRHVETALDKMVWVTVGKTEHQAWLLEELGEADSVLIRWESTGGKERVHVLSVRTELPGRRSRRGTTFFSYAEDQNPKRKRVTRASKESRSMSTIQKPIQKPLKETAPKPLKRTEPKTPKPVPVEKKRRASSSSESGHIDNREDEGAMGRKRLIRRSSKTPLRDPKSRSRKRKHSGALDLLDSRDDQLEKPTKSEEPRHSTKPKSCVPPNLVDLKTTRSDYESLTVPSAELSSDDDDYEPALRIWDFGKLSGSSEEMKMKGDVVLNRISPPSDTDDESSLPTLQSDRNCFPAEKEISKDIPEDDADSSDDEALIKGYRLGRKSNTPSKRHGEQAAKSESTPVPSSAWEALVTASTIRSEFDC